MRNISFIQFIIFLLLVFFLFGDFNKLKKKIIKIYKNISSVGNRKKGTWTLNFWFWKPTLYQLSYFPLK